MSARRRRGAHDAAAGLGRPVERSGRRSHGGECVITHAAIAALATYAKVAGARPADSAGPTSIKLRDPKEWRFAGKPMKRLDTADSSTGSKIYRSTSAAGHAARRGESFCPVFGGKLVSYDESKLSGRPGVRGVVK